VNSYVFIMFLSLTTACNCHSIYIVLHENHCDIQSSEGCILLVQCLGDSAFYSPMIKIVVLTFKVKRSEDIYIPFCYHFLEKQLNIPNQYETNV